MRRAGQCEPAIMAAELQPMGCGCAVQSAILAFYCAVMAKVTLELRQVGGADAVLLLLLSCCCGLVVLSAACLLRMSKDALPHETQHASFSCHMRVLCR